MKKQLHAVLIGIILALFGLGRFAQPVMAVSSQDTVQIKIEVEEKFYQVKVTILDQAWEPIEGAKVTLYSSPITRFTNTQGLVVFDNVPRGEHRIVVEHKGQIGERKIVLTGPTEEFDLRVTLEPTGIFTRPEVAVTISGLVLIVLILSLWIVRMKRRGSHEVLRERQGD